MNPQQPTVGEIPAPDQCEAKAVINEQPQTVAALLQASRRAHDQKRRQTGQTDKSGAVSKRPNYPVAESFIADALRLREAALALDPDMTDPEWAKDVKPTHAQLMAFFTAYPLIP